MSRCFAPKGSWRAEVATYLTDAFGEDEFLQLTSALARPPLYTSIRFNPLTASGTETLEIIQKEVGPSTVPFIHPALPMLLLIPGSGPHELDYSICGGKEVVVSRKAGEAILRGAPVYAPGVLACSSGINEGDLVAVSVAVEKPGSQWCGITRGTILDSKHNARQQAGDRSCMYIGVARSLLSRTELFRRLKDTALVMEQCVFDVPLPPAVNEVLANRVLLQNLPSVLTAVVLGPSAGARVMDMCAAPGGKTTAIAEMMRDQGEVVALDRSHNRVLEVIQLARRLNLTCIKAFKMDATQAVAAPQQEGGHIPNAVQSHFTACGDADPHPEILQPEVNEKVASRQQRKLAARILRGQVASEGALAEEVDTRVPLGTPYPPESFDFVLLDGPCSALGLRPRLAHHQTLEELRNTASYQRRLIDAAVKLVKPGGTLVYSTCTINPGENEGNVRYTLDRYPCMKLVPQEPRLGAPGLVSRNPPTPAEPEPTSCLQGCIPPSTPEQLRAAQSEGGSRHPAPETRVAPAPSSSPPYEQWLTPSEAMLVQRFSPCGHEDTIGFFMAKYVKQGSMMTSG